MFLNMNTQLSSRLCCSFLTIIILVYKKRHICQTFTFMNCHHLISILPMICLCLIINICTWQCPQIHTQSLKLISEVDLLFANSEGDECEKLVKYIDWFARKTSKLVNKFAAAKYILLKHDYMFKALRRWSNDKFNRMNIIEDIANQIKSYIDKFLDTKAKGCI